MDADHPRAMPRHPRMVIYQSTRMGLRGVLLLFACFEHGAQHSNAACDVPASTDVGVTRWSALRALHECSGKTQRDLSSLWRRAHKSYLIRIVLSCSLGGGSACPPSLCPRSRTYPSHSLRR